ncbi:MAG: flagellar hook-associated protein FlgK [Cereibacter sp.]
MSLSLSLSSAMSGLQASARSAELVSSNVANALTDGYGRREIQLTARSLGGTGSGVEITGVVRVTDQILLSDRRVAQANMAGSTVLADAFARLEAVIGTPEDAASLGGKIAGLDQALLSASGRPESEQRLAAVLTAAQGLANHVAKASIAVQMERERADDWIAENVKELNDTLAKVAALNAQILKQVVADRDASPLMDQRQQLIDRIAEIVPLRQIDRETGRIALISTGGAVLLDGRPALFGFTPVGKITPDMTLESGALSGLTMNGKPVTFGEGSGKLDGGAMAANFRLRDIEAPLQQKRLDAAARDLIARFADPSVDTTLPAGAPGLFTDAGAAFTAATETGLAGRLAVNAAADPAKGGALWRLRDGLGATAEGPPGDSALLTGLRGRLNAFISPASGGFEPGARSFSGLASDVLSYVSRARNGAEAEQSYAAARHDSLRADELAAGVDTDQQLQSLLLIERAYGANAQVIKTVDSMIKLWLGM